MNSDQLRDLAADLNRQKEAEEASKFKVNLVRSPKRTYQDMEQEELENLFRRKLSSNRDWALKGLITLYNQQTEAERLNPLKVHESNGRGFSPQDQEFLSSLAHQHSRGIDLSEKQMYWVHELLPKYSSQLASLVKSGSVRKVSRTLQVKTSEVMWMNGTGTSYTEKLGFDGDDEKAYPHFITVSSPSGLMVIHFKLDQDAHKYDSEGEILQVTTYTAAHEGNTITLMIINGAEPGPDWSLYPDGTEMVVKKGIGF